MQVGFPEIMPSHHLIFWHIDEHMFGLTSLTTLVHCGFGGGGCGGSASVWVCFFVWPYDGVPKLSGTIKNIKKTAVKAIIRFPTKQAVVLAAPYGIARTFSALEGLSLTFNHDNPKLEVLARGWSDQARLWRKEQSLHSQKCRFRPRLRSLTSLFGTVHVAQFAIRGSIANSGRYWHL